VKGAAVQELREVRPDADLEFVPGEVVVRFRAGVDSAERRDALDAAETSLQRELLLPRLVVARIDDGSSPLDAARELEQLPDVLYAEPNYVYRGGSTIPNDTRFGELWGLHQASDKDVDAPEAWDVTTGSSDVVVAIVDSGLAFGHPDLAPNIWTNSGETGGGKETNGIDDDSNGRIDDWRGWDVIDGDNHPIDEQDHGTHVGGTVAARGNDGTGVVGVSWSSKLMAVRVLNELNSGTLAGFAEGFTYACQNGADIVNGSLGGTNFSNAMRDAILACPDTLFVFAAMNNAQNLDTNPAYPCLYHKPPPQGVNAPNVLCVAATTSTDDLASFSNFSATGAHLGAPGASVLSSIPAQQSLVLDQFEDAGSLPGTWTASGTATWARTNERSVSPAFSLTDSAGGNYAANADARVARAAVSLAGREGCDLSYNMRLAVEHSFDFLRIDRATAAAGPWTQVTTWTGFTSGGSFGAFSTPLGALDGSATAHVSFRLTSDATNQNDGAHLDDVRIECLSTAPGAADYAYFNGTSMATPHVAGAAALLLAADPTLTVDELKAALLGGVEPIPALAGKTVTGGRLNVRNSLDLILESRDVPYDFDGDGDTDIGYYRPSTGVWVVHNQEWVFFPAAAGDIEVSADYDGDGDTDMAFYRPSTGVWVIRGQPWIHFPAQPGDVLLPADYDGDGAADIAFYRPSTGVWVIRNQEWVHFPAQEEDVLVPADYDGDGDTDLAYLQAASGVWVIRNQEWVHFPSETPLPADYDGDGDTDLAYYQIASGVWVIRNQEWVHFPAQAGDIPLSLPAVVRDRTVAG
jgi:subtilisin family serine protease